MKTAAFVVLSGLVLAGCQSTQGPGAYTSTVATTQGKPIMLNFITQLNADCTSAGQLVIRVVDQPTNGKVVVTQTNDYPNYTSGNQRYHCNAKRVPGVSITYTPNPGFLGTDRVVAENFFPSGRTSRATFVVSVR